MRRARCSQLPRRTDHRLLWSVRRVKLAHAFIKPRGTPLPEKHWWGGLQPAQARLRARALEASTSGLQSLAEKLEDSLASLSAVNARLHQSEARYKGLVDAQGDAILRRGPDSCLTYGNDSFFRLFGLDPQRAIGCANGAVRCACCMCSSAVTSSALRPTPS